MKKYFTSENARTLINTYGFALFPVHGIDDAGNCTCGNRDCTNKGKHPATRDGFKSASKDIEEVKALWGGRAGLNVGIATGEASGVFVVDIDGPEGEKEIAALGQLPKTLTVTTGKGRHLYFRHPGRAVQTRKGVIGDKVDIRGDGGYVVGPGSHHESGSVYQFYNPLEDIADAPGFLLERIEKKFDRPVGNIIRPDFPKTSITLSGWTIDDVKDMLNHISPDVPYDEWIAVGMALHSEGYSFNLWDDWSRMGEKYDGSTAAHWRSFTAGKGTTFGTLVHMAGQGGFRKSRNTDYQSRYNEAVVTTALTRNNEDVNKTDGVIDSDGFRLTDWIAREKFKGTAKEIEWLVEGVFPLGVPAVYAAMGGLGKSFSILDLCIKVADTRQVITPRKAFGGEVQQRGKAVFLSAEDSRDSIHRRISSVMDEQALEATMDNLIIVPMPELGGPQQLVKEGRDGLQITDFFIHLRDQLCEIDDLKLISIDPLQAFVGADVTSKPEAAQFMWSAFANIASQTKATFICTHHMRKDGLKDIKTAADAREAIRGTTGIIDGSRLAYAMWQAGEAEGFKMAKAIGADYEPFRFIRGAVVKTNDIANHDIQNYLREDNGLLKEVGYIDIDGDASGCITTDQAREALKAILDAWNKGDPFRSSPQSPRSVTKWLMKTFKMTKSQAIWQRDMWMCPPMGSDPLIEERSFVDEHRHNKTGLFVKRIP